MWSKYLESEGWRREMSDTTLGELLEAREFDPAEFVTNWDDMGCTFIWREMELSDEAKEEFKDILSLPVTVKSVKGWYPHENIWFWYGGTPKKEAQIEKRLREFLLACAGYVSEDQYEKWFIEKGE